MYLSFTDREVSIIRWALQMGTNQATPPNPPIEPGEIRHILEKTEPFNIGMALEDRT